MLNNNTIHVFQALANESRRCMVDIVREEPGIGSSLLANAIGLDDYNRVAECPLDTTNSN